MISDERLYKIKEILDNKKFVSTKELADTLYVSMSTIRRDLIELENQGMVARSRGGVSLISDQHGEFSSYVRSGENIEKKKIIAQLANNFLNDYKTMFIDSSSTCLYLTDYFAQYSKLSVITNSLMLPYVLNNDKSTSIYCSGGVLKPYSFAFVGYDAIKYVNKFKTELCFFSCNYVDKNGIYGSSLDQVELKEAMIRNSAFVILLADSSKFNRSTLIKITNFDEVDYIITDQEPVGFNTYDETTQKKFIWPKQKGSTNE